MSSTSSSATEPRREAAAGRLSVRRGLVALILLALAGGCTAPRYALPPEARQEISATPFFPQRDYQCGPAALATVLAHNGAAVTADELVPQVWLPARRGSLQPELLAATRRAGQIPYVIEPHPGALFAELHEGRPVLVLQNLGVSIWPVWHYAVLVGSDGDAGRVALRSGTTRRKTMRLSRFLRSWEYGNNWGFVALQPGELPAGTDSSRYARALADAEPLLGHDAALGAWRAALSRWPGDALILFGAANRLQAAGQLAGAERLYRSLLADAPDHLAARNNLAMLLGNAGCGRAARAEISRALDHARPDDPLFDTLNLSAGELAAAPDWAPGCAANEAR